MTRSSRSKSPGLISTHEPERALLAQVVFGDRDPQEAQDSLTELERLADTAGVEVAGAVTQRRNRPSPGLLMGSGKIEDVKLSCKRAGANLVIFDNELTPVQVNNIDMALGVKVIDRTELILQIFARRASSSEAQAQVELAQLRYLVSRIPVSEKQQRFQGGIGMRGPGESPFQLRREPMQRRITDLERRIEAIRKRRQRTRQRRKWPVVCLVGYTNAGKSTLMNAFTKADAYVDDRLFATLDTRTRIVKTAGHQRYLLSDTVGFIRHLPHGLVASFLSTLEVAAEADLLVIVADASHPHVSDHLQVVAETLAEIGADEVPSILLLNKCDLVEAKNEILAFSSAYPDAIPISARTGAGLELAGNAIEEKLEDALHSGHAHR